MPKVNMESLLPFIEEAFNRGLDFQIPITGTSMNPLLYQNRDFVKIVKPSLPLKLGDIPLYRRADGVFVLHRVVGFRDNGEYIMCGDNQFILEYGITDKNIIGIAKALIIDGREIDVDADPDYLRHKEKYLKNLRTRYPIRRARYKLHKIKSGIRSAECGVEEHKSSAEAQGAKEDVIKTGEILISAIKAFITEGDFEFPEDTDFQKLYSLAQSHRVTAMIAPLVMKSQLPDGQVKGKFSKELFKNSARYSAQERERQELSQLFSDNQIRHCFLKGAKVGDYYNNPDCRFMLDMDLFVEPEKYDLAGELLLARGYEINSNADDKDTSFIKKPFLIVELHRELKYEYDKGYDYYISAFERMTSPDGFNMNMTNEDFFVYILSHSAHHFENGGTGIKSIVDHYFLRQKLKPQCDSAILRERLREIGLAEFSEKTDMLCDFWFENGEGSDIIREMSDFVILSGVFGNKTNFYLSAFAKGRLGDTADSYLLKRLFPPLKNMAFRYTVLKKLPFLLPLFWCVRIISAVFDRDRISAEAKTVTSANNGKKQQQKDFLENIGL